MMKSKYSFFNIVKRSVLDYFKVSSWWGIIEQSVLVFRALSWLISIYATERLFNSVSSSDHTVKNFSNIALNISFVAIVIILQQLLTGFSQYLFSKVSYTNMGIFMVKFQKKLNKLPAENFENINFLNKLDRAKDCLEYESFGHFSSICLQFITYYLVFFISVGNYLFITSPILPLIIVISFIPAILGQVLRAKQFEKIEEQNAPLKRKSDYYKKTLIDRTYFKETRILGSFSYFHKLFMYNMTLLSQRVWKTEKKITLIHFILNMGSFLGLGSAILILFYATINDNLSLGSFMAIFLILFEMFSIADEIVSRHFSDGSEIVNQIAIYYELMDMQEISGNLGEYDEFKGIVAKGVYFSYPNQDQEILTNINLTINSGETLAIVGENGSGKSTLIKLLMGLYVPKNGTVEVGGLDTVKVRPNIIYSNISAVFQKYQRYKMTLEENVAISNLTEKNINKIVACLKDAEFKKNIKLSQILSPEFDGVDLSGGQWQRVAIARSLYKESSIIILDEPTSAIDPIEEAMLYKKFQQLTIGKTSIIVTHRLGSARLADKIVVMDKGCIVGLGTHEELLSRRGKYFEMWSSQASWYENR